MAPLLFFFLPGFLILVDPPGFIFLKLAAEGQQLILPHLLLKLMHFSPNIIDFTNWSVTTEELQ